MENKEKKANPANADDRWKRFNWVIQTFICCVAVIVVGTVSFGFYRSNQLYQKYFPLADASMEMRLEAVTGYLWFEEMLGGDENHRLDDINTHLDLAEWYAEAMLEGGQSEHLALLPLRDPPLQEKVIDLQNQLKFLRELLSQRLKAVSSSGPGSEIDQFYHAELENFISLADRFEMDVKYTMARDYQRLKFIIIGVIACCVLLFIIIGLGFYRYESLRRKHYLESLQMESMLVHTEKMAALGMMITGITHEINNPNGAILLNLPILKDYLEKIIPIVDKYAEKNPDIQFFNMPYEKFRADVHALLKNITSGANRINLIVSDLKEFSKKKGRIKKEWVELETIIEKVITLCSARIDSLVKSLEIDIQTDLKPVHCDPEIVELILVNFLINAAEAADKEDSWIRLNIFSKEDTPYRTVIEVRDNGCGIREDVLENIFAPFFSTKSTRKGAGGMGLYLCHTFAYQMGARIEVESEPGEETVFRLIIETNGMT